MDLNNIQIKPAPKLGLSSEQVKQILEQYYQGVSPSKIEQDWGLKTGTISYFKKKMQLPKYTPYHLTEENIADAVNDHINGKLLKDVCTEYNISSATVYRYMKQHNIIYKNGHGRKNHFNQDYFENIDTEHKAYWLGFIYADGNVHNTGCGCIQEANRLAINISNKDIELLKAFCNDIEYDQSKIVVYEPKGTYSTNLMCKLSVNSIKMCSDLAKWGVHPNKTGTLDKLPDIPEELMPHFIRGFFDGDGWCTFTEKSSDIGIIGDYDFLSEINNYLNEHFQISLRKLVKENRREFPVYYLRYHILKDYKLIYNCFYSNATIFLQRKHDKMKALIS